MKEKIEFIAKGLVYGNTWGGGKCGYQSKELKANTREELLQQATKGIENGSLDSGMGYESIIGAALVITKITIVTIKGKNYKNKESEIALIGNLTEEEQDLLINYL